MACASSTARCACRACASDFERLFNVSGVHPRQNLPGGHGIADVDQQFGDAARILGSDIDLVGLDATIAEADADGNGRMRLPPEAIASAAGSAQDNKKREHDPPSPASGPCSLNQREMLRIERHERGRRGLLQHGRAFSELVLNLHDRRLQLRELR